MALVFGAVVLRDWNVERRIRRDQARVDRYLDQMSSYLAEAPILEEISVEVLQSTFTFFDARGRAVLFEADQGASQLQAAAIVEVPARFGANPVYFLAAARPEDRRTFTNDIQGVVFFASADRVEVLFAETARNQSMHKTHVTVGSADRFYLHGVVENATSIVNVLVIYDREPQQAEIQAMRTLIAESF